MYVGQLRLTLNIEKSCGSSFWGSNLGSKGKEILVSFAGMKGLYAFARIDARHVPVTYTSANCIYANIQHIWTDTCICPRACEYDDAENGFVRSSTERQQNANARIIYAKFARRRVRGERAWQNAKYRMQNVNRAVDSIRESEVEIGLNRIEGEDGWVRLEDLHCAADSIDWKSGWAFVIFQIVHHVIFRFSLVWTYVQNSHFVNRLHPDSFFLFYLSIATSLDFFKQNNNEFF